MTRAHTRHARLTHREMQLAPTHQLPLHGAALSWRSYVAFGVMVFLVVGAL